MKVKIRDRLRLSNLYGLFKSIIEMIQTNNLKFSKKVPKVTLENPIYEVSDLYKGPISEIERKKCKALSQAIIFPYTRCILR
jgi:hypothetical protein